MLSLSMLVLGGCKCVLRLTTFRVEYGADGELVTADRSFKLSKYILPAFVPIIGKRSGRNSHQSVSSERSLFTQLMSRNYAKAVGKSVKGIQTSALAASNSSREQD